VEFPNSIPIFVDGLIRVRGRLRNSEIEPDAKHPVLLPKDHHVSHLIILHYHCVSGHSDIEHTLSLRRQKYWITQARAPVRRLLSSCFDYRRRRAPLGQQKMASLVKQYGVLFTCLSIRAIHIALRQFMAQRGQPLQMRSDNG